jgi:hypothetical protein
MILITDLVIVFFTARLVKSKTSREGRSAMRGIYLGASVGMLAFLVSQLFG